MSDETKPDFDPRFDPAFQRGFDPGRSGSHAAAPRITPPPSRGAVAGAAPAAGPAPASVVPNAVASPPVVIEVRDAEEPAVDSPDDTASSRNPFLIVLVLVAVVLIVVGIWLFVRSGAEFNGGEVRSQGDYVSLQAVLNAAPFVALLGVATAIGVLFVFAVRWRKRH